MTTKEATFEGTGRAFYRCLNCKKVVSEWDIAEGGCPRCGHTAKITPATLTFREKMVQILKHPAIWRW